LNANRIAGSISLGVAALTVLALAPSAQANLVQNGSFEQTTTGSGGAGEFNNLTYTTVLDWSSSGYNFLFAPGTADTTGGNGTLGTVMLWGPGDGSANGLPATSPDGGNFVAADGDPTYAAAISQTINGLTVGDAYAVTFYWAGAQQGGSTGSQFTAPTTEQFNVSLGSQTQSTAVVNNVGEGFTGWMQQTFYYTATNTSMVLSFLAAGTPTGEPPFVLLDGVSMDEVVPEPRTFALMAAGLLALVVLARRQRLKKRS